MFQTVLFSHPDDPGPSEPAARISLNFLNPAQQAAASHPGGPILVIAGAGTGKTRTLVHRMAWLLEQGMQPEEILLLTYTRLAAEEMLARAVHMSGLPRFRFCGGTFHSFASLTLRRLGAHVGLRPGFSILDRADADGIVGLLKSALGFSGGSKRFPSNRIVLNVLSAATNKRTSIKEELLDSHPHLVQFAQDFETISEHYGRWKQEHDLVDFDDLLLLLWRLLSGPAQQEVCAPFRHLLVDEYQDVNWFQTAIVRMLGSECSVMAVGDDSQSIFGFRGSDCRNILEFPSHFSGCRMVVLEDNYRSIQPILDLANAILSNAKEKFVKRLRTAASGGSRPELLIAASESDEARQVAERIRTLLSSGMPPSEIAVLFRAGRHSFALERELAGIPFEKRGGQALTEAAHIKDMLSFVRILTNSRDRIAWHRILLQIDRIGPKTAGKILDALMSSPDPLVALASLPAKVDWKDGLQTLCHLLHRMSELGLMPRDVWDMALAYYLPILERIHPDDWPRRRKDLEQFSTIAASCPDLRSLVDDMALDPPSESKDDGLPKLVLSTIHKAKGLEWDAVFVIGLAEGRFPACGKENLAYEEERRLLYVACTRARKKLCLSWPSMVMTPDRKFIAASASPFLAELDQGLFEKAKFWRR